MNYKYVVITYTGGMHQAKGFETIEEACKYKNWLYHETCVVGNIAKID